MEGHSDEPSHTHKRCPDLMLISDRAISFGLTNIRSGEKIRSRLKCMLNWSYDHTEVVLKLGETIMEVSTKVEWVTVDQVAEAFSITTATVYREVKLGKIPSVKIGGSIRISKEWLDTELAPFLPEDQYDDGERQVHQEMQAYHAHEGGYCNGPDDLPCPYEHGGFDSDDL